MAKINWITVAENTATESCVLLKGDKINFEGEIIWLI